ncbi:MAG: S8 family peptidase [Candidatus Zixiibacteriota bacterium]
MNRSHCVGHIVKVGLVSALLSAALSVPVLAQEPSGKYTERAQSLVNAMSSQSENQFWLYLDSSAVESSPVTLTERARKRRAKVDPVNLLIDRRDYPVRQSVIQQIQSTGVSVKRVSRWLKAVAIETDANRLAKAASLPFVRQVDPVRTLVTDIGDEVASAKPVARSLEAIDFDYGPSLFQTEFINALKLHQAGLTGEGVTIAFFDGGFDPSHEAFDSTSIIATYDFINDDVAVDEPECPSSFSTDQTFHGTATLSVVGGYTPGTLIGVAHDADFVLAKTEITCNGTEVKMEEYNWIAAAEWADSIGVDIINSSLGYNEFQDSGSYTFEDLDGNTTLITIAADIAASKNILVVNSAGNERNNTWGHIIAPADGDSVLAVGAANPDSTLASFSSPGPTADGRIKPDITALGVSVVAASHVGGFTLVNGTSFSAPLTAGGAALALQRDPTLTAAELVERIKLTGSKSAIPDNDFGYGLFNAARTANLFVDFSLPDIIEVGRDQTQTFDFTSSGWTDDVPSFTGINLPGWVILTDNGDGTGSLEVSGELADVPSVEIGLIASLLDFSDTSFFTIQVYGTFTDPVTAGPNPFIDQVSIFVGPEAGNIQSISFFNSSGEKVWEKVNNFSVNADALSVLVEHWDGRNQSGKVVAAGVYIVVINTDRQTYRVKLLKAN